MEIPEVAGVDITRSQEQLHKLGNVARVSENQDLRAEYVHGVQALVTKMTKKYGTDISQALLDNDSTHVDEGHTSSLTQALQEKNVPEVLRHLRAYFKTNQEGTRFTSTMKSICEITLKRHFANAKDKLTGKNLALEVGCDRVTVYRLIQSFNKHKQKTGLSLVKGSQGIEIQLNS